MRLAALLATTLALFATTALADPQPKGNGHQGCVAQATLQYKADGSQQGSTGNVISDRNTNPDNTYYADNGYSGRGDEVSSIAKSCKGN